MTFSASQRPSVLHLTSVWSPATGGEYRHTALCGLKLPARYVTDDDGLERCLNCHGRIKELTES